MKKILLVFFFLLVFFAPINTKADGGIMPPPDRWIYETDQRAVIISENGLETLILSVSYKGNAEDFAWIIPTPSKPEVSKGAVDIFEALEKLTNVNHGSNRIYNSLSLGEKTYDAAPTTTVIEKKKVGFYDIVVLESNDKDSLYNWLKDNSYNYPSYGKTILDDYIQNKWFFTAVKINNENIKEVQRDLRLGTITPLKLVFKTDKIIFPLKISSITMQEPIFNEENSNTTSEKPTNTDIENKKIAPISNIIPNNYTNIRLYVFADHKKQVGDFYTLYANWINSKDIRELTNDDNGNPWYSPQSKKMFLTVLNDSMGTKDMKNDLFLSNAENNKKIPTSQFWLNLFLTILLTTIIILSPLGLLYIIFMLLFIFIRSIAAKIVFLIFQIIIALSGITISTVLLVVLVQDPASMSDAISVLISSLLVTIVMITGIILEVVIGKRKKIL
uniref:DUF2330 domain-containing protein n=1 Tax=candidate division CPR3 bacterium TaxID=2268181 RepID=A0A7C4M1L0_UNCC3